MSCTRRLRRWLLFPAVAAVLIAPACAPAAPPADQPLTPQDIEAGRVLYATNGCPSCHGDEGRGDGGIAATLLPPPRDFRDPTAFKHPRTVADLAAVIAAGLPATPTAMPAYDHLDLLTRRRIAGYVLSLGGTAPHAF